MQLLEGKSHGSPESVYSCSTLGELAGARWREHFTVHSRAHQLNILLLLLKAMLFAFGLLQSEHC